MKTAENRFSSCTSMFYKIYFLQADASIVDCTGHLHPVHSTLLRLKIPAFRDFPKFTKILMDSASPEVVKLICELAHGMDRWLIEILKFCTEHLCRTFKVDYLVLEDFFDLSSTLGLDNLFH